MKNYFILMLLFFSWVASAQKVNYSPAYFGPNANPVPLFTDATIPAETMVQLSQDFYFGFGDNTTNTRFLVEVPLLSEFVSFKVWVTMLEYYKVTEGISSKRQMLNDNTSGSAMGDFYVQTRILIFREKRIMPSIVLNSTLKTASGTKFQEKRYFDTPGYYFDAEIGKSVHTKSSTISELRVVGNLGFLCWETTNSTQNDALMYGIKIILSNSRIDFENSLSGYWGWMRNGDNPLVYNSKISLKIKSLNYHLMYQYGIRDFPYHHLQVGFSIKMPKFTPKYD